MSFVDKNLMKLRVAADIAKDVGRIPGAPVRALTLPVKGAAKLGYRGVKYAGDKGEWTYHAGKEGLTRGFNIAKAPAWEPTKGIFHKAWDYCTKVPAKALAWPFKTVAALAKSPYELATGVRDAIFGNKNEAINSVFRNTVDMFNSMTSLKNIKDSTRKAISDVFTPFTRPTVSILAPSAALAGAVLTAEARPFIGLKRAFVDIIPVEWRALLDSSNHATAFMDRKKAIQAARIAEADDKNAKLKEAKQAQVDKERGKPEIKKDDKK